MDEMKRYIDERAALAAFPGTSHNTKYLLQRKDKCEKIFTDLREQVVEEVIKEKGA